MPRRPTLDTSRQAVSPLESRPPHPHTSSQLHSSRLHSPPVKALAIVLTAFLVAIQAQLWLGKGGLARGVQLRAELRQQEEANEKARARNAQLQAELLDLREGLEMVEEKARMELGMVKADEVFVPLRR